MNFLNDGMVGLLVVTKSSWRGFHKVVLHVFHIFPRSFWSHHCRASFWRREFARIFCHARTADILGAILVNVEQKACAQQHLCVANTVCPLKLKELLAHCLFTACPTLDTYERFKNEAATLQSPRFLFFLPPCSTVLCWTLDGKVSRSKVFCWQGPRFPTTSGAVDTRAACFNTRVGGGFHRAGTTSQVRTQKRIETAAGFLLESSTRFMTPCVESPGASRQWRKKSEATLQQPYSDVPFLLGRAAAISAITHLSKTSSANNGQHRPT